MKKYIAGFRSDNPKKKKVALTYYIIMALFVFIGSQFPPTINDLSFLLVLLGMPSLILNFGKKTFSFTLVAYIMICSLFMYTSPNSNDTTTSVNTDTEVYSNEDTSKSTETNSQSNITIEEFVKEVSTATGLNATVQNVGEHKAAQIVVDVDTILDLCSNLDEYDKTLEYLKTATSNNEYPLTIVGNDAKNTIFFAAKGGIILSDPMTNLEKNMNK